MMTERIVYNLLEHLYINLKMANSANSSFMSNAVEDAVNLKIVADSISARAFGENADDLLQEIQKTSENAWQFTSNKQYALKDVAAYKEQRSLATILD